MRVRKRLRRLKRLAYLGAMVGAVFAVRQARAKREARTNLGPPAAWPPLRAADEPVAAVGDLVAGLDPAPAVTRAARDEPIVSDEPVAAVGAVAADGPASWIDADADGGCPLSHPVKANGSSGIYHVPGGRFYDRTRAERCYTDAAAAEADGYRAAKGS